MTEAEPKGALEIFQRGKQTVVRSNGILLCTNRELSGIHFDINITHITVENWNIQFVGKWRMKIIKWILRR